ncbi:PspA/IM30 family protein [Sphingobacterium tabacisoli]|uniref:PspA/IM30 family protein n=1 Tax=Sphingobacterium tabacisoli TaxID=2044855 RepID=A0ABW5KVY5_9SPHI|nr:PspA/IM30 family protein [Sphingobacterium tabacisoli]
MNIFKRLLKIGQAEIHAIVDKMEDPIVLIAQGISDMKKELIAIEENYIRTRAMGIRMENVLRQKKEESDTLEGKAKLILEKSRLGEINPEIAEKLALEALKSKKHLLTASQELNIQLEDNAKFIEEINTHLEVLKFNISKWEKELTTLKTKRQINATSVLVNRQMANIERNSTIQLLEQMKDKAADEEALAAALHEFAQDNLDRNQLSDYDSNEHSIQNELENLKKKIGLE